MTTYAHDISPDVLAGGEWVCVRGVMRWVPQPAPVLPTEPPMAERVAAAELIACPTCHARVAELCKTTTGRHRAPHSSRLAPKLCGCGKALGFNKKLCDDCRAEARRVNGRRGMRNTRARRRKEAA